MNEIKVQEAQKVQQVGTAAEIEQLVESMNDQYVDQRGHIWRVKADSNQGEHYIEYSLLIGRDLFSFTGPHFANTYIAYADWSDGDELLAAFGCPCLTKLFLLSVEEAAEWCHNAGELAEQAINRHVNLGRIVASKRKLEQERDKQIEAVNKKFDRDIARLEQKASSGPSDDMAF